MSKVAIGFILTGVVWIASACLITLVGWAWHTASNPIVVDDGFRNLKFSAGLCALGFSLAYFRSFEKRTRIVVSIITVVFLLYFGIQYILIRNDQHQILLKYAEFRQASLDEDYLKAYELMSPEWRKNHSVNDMEWEAGGFLGPEDSVYSVHIYGKRAVIVPNPQTTWWFRPSAGNSRSFEKIGSELCIAKKYRFFLGSWLVLRSIFGRLHEPWEATG